MSGPDDNAGDQDPPEEANAGKSLDNVGRESAGGEPVDHEPICREHVGPEHVGHAPVDRDTVSNERNAKQATSKWIKTSPPAADHSDGAAKDTQAQTTAKAANTGEILTFPQSRVTPPRRRPKPFKELGYSSMCLTLGTPKEQTTGHWCSCCKGIWYGYLLEVECPTCGNRDG